MPLRSLLVHRKRSNQLGDLVERRVRREVHLDRRHRHVARRDGVEIGAGPRVLARAGGPDPLDRPIVRIERFDGGLGLVPKAEPRRAKALELGARAGRAR